jgi:polyphosphate kinase
LKTEEDSVTKKNKKAEGAVAETAETAPTKKERNGAYEKEIARLQVEIAYLQRWVVETGARIIVIFEGRDAAGKGGLIKRLVEKVSPRVFRVVALPRRATARSPRCTSSATWRSSRRPAKS